MKILITGAKGFVGRNLTENLRNIQTGKNQTRPEIVIEKIYQYDLDSSPEDLERYCEQADFVFHLAGVNRPQDPAEYQAGNYGFSEVLLNTLKKYGNKAGVMLSSSIQASLEGRFAGSAYGESKLAGENLFFRYQEETGAPVYVYRFPNLFGKWCRPNYNSAVATFCHNTANDLPIQVNDPAVELELLYIDDFVEEMLDLLEGKEHHCRFEGVNVVPDPVGEYCYCPVTHHVTLGEIVTLLEQFHAQSGTLLVPDVPEGSFVKKLYSTYLSYLPQEKMIFDLKVNSDERGSFAELTKSLSGGQFSLNISKPGKVKGQHWHNTKIEWFIVVKGHALIQERSVLSDSIRQFEVDGDHPQVVITLPGYTHNIINVSETDDLITLIWSNEIYDPGRPDTFREEV